MNSLHKKTQKCVAFEELGSLGIIEQKENQRGQLNQNFVETRANKDACVRFTRFSRDTQEFKRTYTTLKLGVVDWYE